MLNKSISTSIQVNKLDLKQRLIFTWIIPHLDDYGLIDKEPELIKALVFPMAKEITEQDIKNFIKKAQELKLIKVWDDCIEFTGFYNHQTISDSKKAHSKYQKTLNPQESPRIPKNFPNKISKEDKISKGSKGRENDDFKKLDDARRRLVESKIWYPKTN